MGIEALLLNALAIFVSIFFYQIIWLDKDKKRPHNDWLVALLSSSTLLLCISFPFEFSTEYIYDLRIIPILLGFFYGGNISKVTISLVYVAYRYYLGGDGFYSAMLSYAIILPVLIIIGSKYDAYSKKKKITVGLVIVIISTIITIAFTAIQMRVINLFDVTYTLTYYVLFMVIVCSTLWLSLYLIEGLIENRKQKLELERSEKINLLGDLASSIAHEIRNPLTVVSGFMQLLRKDQIPEENRDEYMQLMSSELNRAESIITDYLSLTKSDIHTIEQRVNMMSLIRQVIELITPYATLHNVEIRFSPTVPIYMTTNPIKIKQCLLNIIKNGIEAMEAGGVLYIKSSLKYDQLIIDSGVGMTEEEINRLGLPFYSMTEKGTGLGTMISYSIVESMNGKITVQSEKGKGSSFSIAIPLTLKTKNSNTAQM